MYFRAEKNTNACKVHIHVLGNHMEQRLTQSNVVKIDLCHLENVRLDGVDQGNGGITEEKEEEEEVGLQRYFVNKQVSLPTMATISRKVATKRKSTRNNPRSREESDQVSCH